MPREKLDVVKNPYAILTSSTQENTIVTLFTNDVLVEVKRIFPNATTHLSNAFLKNIMSVRRVPSLPGQNPVIENPELSPAQNELAAINAIWQVPRIELDIYQGYPDGSWLYKGSSSLTNQKPFKFVTDDLLGYWTNNLGFEFEHGCKIGVALTNTGAGLLTGADNVIVQASLVCKCDVVLP